MKKLLYGFGLVSSFLGIFLLLGGATLFTPASSPPIEQSTPAVKISATEQTSLLIQPEAGVMPLLESINQAISSIDLTIYTISDPQIIGSLISAEKRGVKVRVLYNDKFFSGTGNKSNLQTINILSQVGIQTKKASSDFVLTHQKSFIFDAETAIIMTFNLDPSYFSSSRDFAIITTDPGAVAEIKAVFEADWEGIKIYPNTPSLVWSPDNSRAKLKKLINDAGKTLEIYAMELEDPEMMDALMQAAKRGVIVRVISAELWDKGGDANASSRQALNKAGVVVRKGSPLFVHAKMILADYGINRQMAYIGSINFSENSLNNNRELGILSSDKVTLDQLEQVFNKDWILTN